jgi:predicted O-linked N-acetylglucosamine transferase (SPINDLY family)
VIGSFSSRGVAPDRITLIDWQPIDRYLETYNCIDVALDTWPCAGGATTCDALWMGVPVISLSGERSYSRTGASLLASVRLDDLVAETPQAYVETAIAVARDRERLESLRVGLRSRMQLSPLLNPHAFARDVEAAFAEMWDRRVAAHGTGKE